MVKMRMSRAHVSAARPELALGAGVWLKSQPATCYATIVGAVDAVELTQQANLLINEDPT